MPVLFHEIGPFWLIPYVKTFRVIVVQFTIRWFIHFQIFSQVRLRGHFVCILEVVDQLPLFYERLDEIWHICPFQMKKRRLIRAILDPSPAQQHSPDMLVLWVPYEYQSILTISTLLVIFLHRYNFLWVIGTATAHHWPHFLLNFFHVVCLVLFDD